MTHSVGTPPLLSLGVADTGSDQTWTQCKPCTECFTKASICSIQAHRPRTHPSPANPITTALLCKKQLLAAHTCQYLDFYGDMSYTTGILATNTITLEDSSYRDGVSFSGITFGCGESRIVGLGGGNVSLVRQIGQGKFFILPSVAFRRFKVEQIDFWRKCWG